MFTSAASFPKTGCVALVLALTGLPALAADPVGESFDRMLAHEAAAVATPAFVRGAADPLVAALVVPLRDGVRLAGAAAASDAVAESFARMLHHAPSWATPPLPAGAGVDPLVHAVVWPLLRSHQITVAGIAPHPAP